MTVSTPTRTRTLTVANSKGGTAKTTSTVNLAGALAASGRRVLVVDLDPQGSATDWLAARPGRPLRDLGDRPARILEGALPPEEGILVTDHGIDLLPANRSLALAARTLAELPGGDRSLRAVLRPLARAERSPYDLILIDTPAHDGTLSNTALLAADGLVLSVEARHLGLRGLAHTLTRVHRMGQLERSVPITALLVCRLDRRTRQSPALAEEVRTFAAQHLPGVPVCEIRENIRLSEAAAAHQPITTFAPHAPGTADYHAAARHLLDP